MSNQTKAGEKPPVLRYEKERQQFRALILGNPNYFGNIKASPFKPVLKIQGDTTFEEIGCVGFQPQLNRLEAVVFIKQPTGYGGDVCSAGTPEYVRFYISFDNGTTWQDQGVESFAAYNIPEGTSGAKRLEYAVTRRINPPKKFCFVNNLALVRAILSWNVQPPPNDPNFIPVWGSVHNTHIQIDPKKFFILVEALKDLEVKIPTQLVNSLDLTHPIPAAETKALGVAELQELYRGKNVEPHRFALAEVHKFMSQPELTESLMAPGFEGVLGKLDINLPDLIGKLFPTDGNTSYEELVCVGLNSTQSALVGVIRVKLSSGYSGGPCTTGSHEYVTFWADFNDNGTFETCLGTASVRVFDIENIPKDGLEYSVFLPVDLTAHRQPCEQGPKVVKIRAILSWQVPPPCGNPNYVPVWGNREETLVHITGPVVAAGDFSPFLYEVNGAAVCNIDQTTGLAVGDQPFGGTVYIMGEIPAAAALTLPDTLKYQVSVRPLHPDGTPVGLGLYQPLTNSFDIEVLQGFGPSTGVSFGMVQAVDGDQFYTYREYGTPVTGAWRRVSSLGNLLAAWITSDPMTGFWEIKIEAKDTLTNTLYVAATTTCFDGTTRQNVKVWLDEVAPTADVTITGFSVGPGPIQPAGDCATFTKGVTVHGTYSVADEHFGYLTLTIEPAGPANGAAVNPSARSYPAVPDAGESGTWTLDTGPMDPCGYVVRLYTCDRTRVGFGNGTNGGWYVGRCNEDFSGFCLEAPET
jgi:hypothetical protein